MAGQNAGTPPQRRSHDCRPIRWGVVSDQGKIAMGGSEQVSDASEITKQEQRLRKLLTQKMGIRDAPLEIGLRRAGRRLPKRMQKAGKGVVAAIKMAGHPRLSRQIDMAQFRAQADLLVKHLQALDVRDRRKGQLLSVLGGLAFNLLLLGALLLALALWMGWV